MPFYEDSVLGARRCEPMVRARNVAMLEAAPRGVTLPLKLKFPITIGSGREARKYSELELRPPNINDIRRIGDYEPGTEQVIALIALVAAVPMEVVERMGPRDYYTACKFLEPFSEHPYGE